MTRAAEERDFARLLDEVARELVRVERQPDGWFLQLPVLYPSGVVVVVRVMPQQGGRYLVSDMGLGYREADLIGATAIYSRQARRIAAHAGIGFDEHAFFVIDADKEQLPGAVAAVGTCSQSAVVATSMRLTDKRYEAAAGAFIERLESVFRRDRVDRDVELAGASNHVWNFRARVRADGGTTLFEPVKHAHAAVATAVVKFHDVARLDMPPRRVAVVHNTKEFGTYLALLTQAASVVEETVPEPALRKLAA